MIRRLLAFGALLFLYGCPPDLEQAPATLVVEGFELAVQAGQGAATTDIREVWAFVDDVFHGVYPLPARIPIFDPGPVRLRLEAGIRQDGRSVTPDIYPFYTPFVRDLQLAPGETTDLGTLTIGYRPEAVFGFVEGFEPGGGATFTERLTSNGAELTVQREVVRSGEAAGAIMLGDSSRLFEAATGTLYRDLNRVPINVWLEVDYRGEAPSVFGVIGQQNGQTVRVFDPGILPREQWTKVYLNLSAVVGSADLSALRIALSTLLGNERSSGTVYLDNLKLLYLPAT